MPEALSTKLITMWEKSAAETMEKLREAVKDKDEKQIRVHLHTLKGVSAQVGATTVSEIAAQMEKAKKVPSDVKKLKILDMTIAQTIAKYKA